ncbi:MAG: RluA family pseudouridine synthase [Gammaproteobacteria bacterium]|nr:RluA family pseudouridine synthase [Gammaproteobacteria bacterium]
MSSSTPSKPSLAPAVTYQEVGENQDGQRLDNYLLARLKGVPKSRIYRIIRKGEVRVNKKRAKPEHKLKTGDLVRIPPVRVATIKTLQPPTDELQALLRQAVLFEDDAILVINKPSGIAVHGGTGVKVALIDALRHMNPDLDGLELVHRIDKGTSGCLVVAKNSKALKTLAQQFKSSAISKVYHALVEGSWPEQLTEINAALRRQDEKNGERYVDVATDGKAALTRFTILEVHPNTTLIEAKPVTGRTHQIRVHAQLAGHPIIGDDKYSATKARRAFAKAGVKRLCLHAAAIELMHPETGEKMTFNAPYDKQFEQALATLRVRRVKAEG